MQIAAILALSLAAPVAAEEVIIRDDGGGNITEYRARRQALARADSVRIAGKCLSACTIFTTLPNACVNAGATFGFHGTTPKSGIAAVDYALDMRMGEFYRGEVRRLYEREWRHLGGSNAFKILSGADLVKLDPKIRLCAPRKGR